MNKIKSFYDKYGLHVAAVCSIYVFAMNVVEHGSVLSWCSLVLGLGLCILVVVQWDLIKSRGTLISMQRDVLSLSEESVKVLVNKLNGLRGEINLYKYTMTEAGVEIPEVEVEDV